MTAQALVGYFPLPDHFQATPDQQKAIEALFNRRLPYEVDLKWQTNKAPMHASIWEAAPWPTMVKFADMVPAMEACEPGTVVMGITRDGKPFYRSFKGDTPHWGFSVNTGFGKSTMFCVTGAQILHQEPDSSLICIDPKAVSFNPLIGIPGVTVHNSFRDVRGMWKGIEDHLGILYKRMDLLTKDYTLTFPSQVLMLDELNMFALLTDEAWSTEKEEKGVKGPATAPIWKKLLMCLAAGRQFSCYVIIMAQRLDDKSTGRLGLQTILNLKAMAGFGPHDWRRFIGTYPIPLSSSTCGRWIYTNGQQRAWVQNTYSDIMDGMEIRDYAMANRSGLLAAEKAEGELPRGTQWVIGLEPAAKHLGLSKGAFVKRRQRTRIPGEEKQKGQPMWRAQDLDAWADKKNAIDLDALEVTE